MSVTIRQIVTAGEHGDYKLVFGYDGTNWRPLLIDAAGNLQIDIAASALPAGAATSANQATIIGYVDGIEGYLQQIEGNTDGIETQLAGDLITVAPPMLTHYLHVEGDATTNAFAPTAGKAIEVLGYSIVEARDLDFTFSTGASLYFEALPIYVWGSETVDVIMGVPVTRNHQLSHLRVHGAVNEPLKLGNYNWTNGAATIGAVIYYREV